MACNRDIFTFLLYFLESKKPHFTSIQKSGGGGRLTIQFWTKIKYTLRDITMFSVDSQ
jgi:hypothetical protein